MHLVRDHGVWTWACDIETALRRPPQPNEQNYLANALQMSLSVGTEVWLGPFALRAGMSNIATEEGLGRRTRPTLGIGVVWGQLSLDAAYVHTSPGYSYIVALDVAFSTQR